MTGSSLPVPLRLVRVGIGRRQHDAARHHHRVLIQLVDRVFELGGQPLGDRVLDVGLLDGEDVRWARGSPAIRQPPATAFSNSSQFGLVKALEA